MQIRHMQSGICNQAHIAIDLASLSILYSEHSFTLSMDVFVVVDDKTHGLRGCCCLPMTLSEVCRYVCATQGMNYVAALLLVALDRDEESAFWIMVALMDTDGV